VCFVDLVSPTAKAGLLGAFALAVGHANVTAASLARRVARLFRGQSGLVTFGYADAGNPRLSGRS